MFIILISDVIFHKLLLDRQLYNWILLNPNKAIAAQQIIIV